MNEITELHRQAMDLTDQADAALRRGDGEASQSLFRRAFELERRAAEQLVQQFDAEPTRSVLLRSAATLALECHEYREAERLAAAALAGNPPEEICDELRELLEQLYSQGTFRQIAG